MINIDCFSWNHGTTRTEDWHLCNATASGEPPNLVFYYADAITGGGNVSNGGISTSLSMNSSYYLCYDELNCTTSTSACDESANSYCVGRLEDPAGSTWYSCDTTQSEAKYYRCCTGACDAMEMECAGRLLNQEGTAYANFTSCVEDGTSGCCDDTTDCVYGGECYDQYEVTKFYGINMVCSDGNTWCPNGFKYSSKFDNCEIQEEACYDSTDEAYCNSIFGTDDLSTWQLDTGCVRPNAEGAVSTTEYRVYNETCVPTQLEGIDYYFYQDLYVDK